MSQQVTPMLHVPRLVATVAWYNSIGFETVATFEDGGEMTFAMLRFGSSEIMLNCGGRESREERRDADLYLRVGDVDALHERLRNLVEIWQDPENTFYGTREFIVRDPNRFWLTFAQELKESS